MSKKALNLQMFIVLSVVLLTTVIICFCAATCSGGKLKFEKTYYFVYYRMSDNAVSAGSLSQTASSYGGAGYVLSHGGKYYVTFSCYNSENEADSVCTNLKKRDLECAVLKIETKEYKLGSRNAKNNQNLYLGNLNTLYSLSTLAYECANGLDTGEYSQEAAKQMLNTLIDSLNGLLKTNDNNCFTESINSVIAECKSLSGGFLLSKNMRYIQIMLADKILHAELI